MKNYPPKSPPNLDFKITKLRNETSTLVGIGNLKGFKSHLEKNKQALAEYKIFDLELPHSYGTIISRIVSLKDLGMLKEALDIGFDINRQDVENGNTYLHDIIKTNNMDMFDFLIISGADPTLKNHQGLCPLGFILRSGYITQRSARLKYIEYFKDNMAVINSRNKFKETILHYAIKNLDIDMVQSILNTNNIKIDLRSSGGDTALLSLIQKVGYENDQKITKLFNMLLAHDADITIKNANDLDVVEILQLKMSAGFNVSELMSAIEYKLINGDLSGKNAYTKIKNKL